MATYVDQFDKERESANINEFVDYKQDNNSKRVIEKIAAFRSDEYAIILSSSPPV